MAELMKFGAHMRAARLDKKLSVRTLAVSLGLSAPYVSDIEHGRRAPFPAGEVYANIAKALGGNADDWSARGAAERVKHAVEGLPEHVGAFVCELVVNARHISPDRVRKMRDFITVPAR